MLKPSSFSPVLALIGIIMYMSGKDKKKDIGEILLGFAILMFAMETMSDAVKPLADVPEFTDILTMFNNPVFGVLAGTAHRSHSEFFSLLVSCRHCLSQEHLLIWFGYSDYLRTSEPVSQR